MGSTILRTEIPDWGKIKGERKVIISSTLSASQLWIQCDQLPRLLLSGPPQPVPCLHRSFQVMILATTSNWPWDAQSYRFGVDAAHCAGSRPVIHSSITCLPLVLKSSGYSLQHRDPGSVWTFCCHGSTSLLGLTCISFQDVLQSCNSASIMSIGNLLCS